MKGTERRPRTDLSNHVCEELKGHIIKVFLGSPQYKEIIGRRRTKIPITSVISIQNIQLKDPQAFFKTSPNL